MDGRHLNRAVAIDCAGLDKEGAKPCRLQFSVSISARTPAVSSAWTIRERCVSRMSFSDDGLTAGVKLQNSFPYRFFAVRGLKQYPRKSNEMGWLPPSPDGSGMCQRICPMSAGRGGSDGRNNDRGGFGEERYTDSWSFDDGTPVIQQETDAAAVSEVHGRAAAVRSCHGGLR